MPPDHQITSEEINYLVYRFLQESGNQHYANYIGFVHSAYCFGQESMVHRLPIRSQMVPPGMLIALLQRGLQYHILEQHLDDQGHERPCTRPWSLLQEHQCDDDRSMMVDVVGDQQQQHQQQQEVQDVMPPPRSKNNKPGRKRAEEESASTSSAPSTAKKGSKKKALDSKPASAKIAEQFSSMSIQSNLNLEGHGTGEILALCWTNTLLISSASDSTARTWQPHDGQQLSCLEHPNQTDVTCIDYMQDLILTGCSDGVARLWRDGSPHPIAQHAGAILAIRTSPSTNNTIATVGVDACLRLSSPSGDLVRTINWHQGSCLDVCWNPSTPSLLATCSSDRSIFVISVEQEEPIAHLTGHEDEVNAVVWLDDGRLVSCSDDGTVRIWNDWREQHVLSGHSAEVYTIRARGYLVASASFDCTVRLWDANTGQLLQTMSQHSQPVYSLAFHPTRPWLATGALDGQVYLHYLDTPSAATSQLIHKAEDEGGILELAWSPDGTQLALGTSQARLRLLNF